VLEQAAQVAVGDDAQELLAVVDDGGDAEALLRHLVDGVAHRGVGMHARELLAGVHQLVHAEEALAELAARVEPREVLVGEAARLHHRHRQSVADGERRGGGGGGREVERARLLPDGDREVDVGESRERASVAAGDGDERNAETLQGLDEAQDLFGGAGVGGGEHEVALDQHPEVAVDRFRRVEEHRRRAGRGEGGGHLLHDQAALAHAGAHDAAATAPKHLDGGVEGAVELRQQVADGLRLDLEDLSRHLLGRPCRHGAGV
jgi:hypothetical protein